jgi:membrane fusion protein (multidrug efflux system)
VVNNKIVRFFVFQGIKLMAMQTTAKFEENLRSPETIDVGLRSHTEAEIDQKIPQLPKNAKTPQKRFRLAALIVGSGAIVAGGAAWWLHASSIQDTDDAFITGHVHQLSSRVAGTVLKVCVDDNQHVKAGQLLIKIDPRDYQMSVNTANAAALKAKQQAEEAKSKIAYNAHTADARRLEASYGVESQICFIRSKIRSRNGASASSTAASRIN